MIKKLEMEYSSFWLIALLIDISIREPDEEGIQFRANINQIYSDASTNLPQAPLEMEYWDETNPLNVGDMIFVQHDIGFTRGILTYRAVNR